MFGISKLKKTVSTLQIRLENLNWFFENVMDKVNHNYTEFKNEISLLRTNQKEEIKRLDRIINRLEMRLICAENPFKFDIGDEVEAHGREYRVVNRVHNVDLAMVVPPETAELQYDKDVNAYTLFDCDRGEKVNCIESVIKKI